MITTNNYIERDATDIIKGVALVFMFIHHFFTIPGYYIDGISYPYLEDFSRIFSEPFKICVPIFAFLTGYFYVFTKKKNLKYSLKKGTDVWLTYFCFFLLLLIPAVALGCWDASVKNFLLEAFAIYRPTMKFCWYVYFYIIAILLLPLYHLGAKKHILIAAALGLALPVCVTAVLTDRVGFLSENLVKMLFDILQWFPCVAVGYIVAQYELFEKWFDFLFKRHIKVKGIRIAIYVILMGVAFMGRYFIPSVCFNISIFTVSFSWDFLLVPFFVYGLLNLYYAIPWKKILLPLSVIGKYSLGMWFFHSIFFNSCKEYTQPILYFPKNPILVLLWGLLICFGISFAVTKAIAPLLKLKNRLLFRDKKSFSER
ncbi:MAG: acyltransferase [Ruminococcus sp.]|nr:acyltransferase [Ruminococcus sp.]